MIAALFVLHAEAVTDPPSDLATLEELRRVLEIDTHGCEPGPRSQCVFTPLMAVGSPRCGP